MDLAYLREHPEHLPTFLTHQRIRETPVGGGDICAASRLTLDDGHSIFAKTWPERAGRPVPEDFFVTEAAGLRWLREAGAVAVPEVLVALPDLLALEWVEPGEPSVAAAERFGRELAGLHRAGASAFGAPWTGFIGALPADNTPHQGPWAQWFASARLLPYLRRSVDNGALDGADAALVERVVARIGEFGGEEPPARIHGDLWPGNLLWGADDRVWLIDPAAHGGHRETDLAQLALFGGAAHADRILAAYDETWPLADGWRERVPLHQLHLLLVHTALFGATYRDSVRGSARAALSGIGRATVDG
ncbi:fructosamine kinase family protein [Micromonospora endophytica]|uniref:Aminoglycoside phosphotransferase n=1 Tax=Micromonospora endophytica TaxID=515350 RepID=A0A2W2CCL2_9ACTN|nr:fructosamine kinase family protein [Micromonospora endophytica]PZF97215.1 aminoglycoside phosphotransferase [Micromonospora endophytica]RIW42185.1 aminoglycoside phosphotransferase [Micromonospora endophytica]BCJ59485.1 fructosamine kinase [Micromonospora endophytica]